MNSPCVCNAYPWPHRKGGGKCIWNPRHIGTFCRECAQPCEVEVYKPDSEERSPGEISLSPWAVSSTCCGAAVVRGGEYLRAEDV